MMTKLDELTNKTVQQLLIVYRKKPAENEAPMLLFNVYTNLFFRKMRF